MKPSIHVGLVVPLLLAPPSPRPKNDGWARILRPERRRRTLPDIGEAPAIRGVDSRKPFIQSCT